MGACPAIRLKKRTNEKPHPSSGSGGGGQHPEGFLKNPLAAWHLTDNFINVLLGCLLGGLLWIPCLILLLVNGRTWNRAIMYHLGNSYIKWFFYTTSGLSDYLTPNNECLIFANFLIKCFPIIPKCSHFQLRRHWALHPLFQRCRGASLHMSPSLLSGTEAQAQCASWKVGGHQPFDTGKFGVKDNTRQNWQWCGIFTTGFSLKFGAAEFVSDVFLFPCSLCWNSCTLVCVASCQCGGAPSQGQKAKDAMLHCKIISS